MPLPLEKRSEVVKTIFNDILFIADYFEVDVGEKLKDEISHKIKSIKKNNQYFELIEIIVDTVFEKIIKNKLAHYEKEIDYAVNYIEFNLTKKIALDSVAEYMNISPHYFSKLFKKEMGISCMEYIINLRMKQAQKLLKTTNATVNEIARQVGYSDQGYFSRLFKQRLGISPSSVRDY